MTTATAMHSAFLADILAHPADDFPRKVYADWLRERDLWTWPHLRDLLYADQDSDGLRLLAADWLDGEGQGERAEFVRVQVEYARLHSHFAEHDEEDADCDTCTRAAALSALLATRFDIGHNRHPQWAKDCPSRLIGQVAGPPRKWTWLRGFVHTIETPLQLFLQHGPAIAAQHPLQLVVITDRKPLTDEGDTEGSAQWANWTYQGGGQPDLSKLPNGILDFLTGGTPSDCGEFRLRNYDAAKEARDDLSRACILWARGLLPPG